MESSGGSGGDAPQRGTTSRRKQRKYERERVKRDLVAQQFEQISQLLHLNPGSVDRTTVLEALLVEIKRRKKMEQERNGGHGVGMLAPGAPPIRHPQATPTFEDIDSLKEETIELFY